MSVNPLGSGGIMPQGFPQLPQTGASNYLTDDGRCHHLIVVEGTQRSEYVNDP